MSDDALARLGRFPTHTRWSLISRARRKVTEEQRQALSELLLLYMPALRTHLVLGMRLRSDRVDDLLQGFVTEKILAGTLVAQAKREKGRFRDWLRCSLTRYVYEVHRRETAKKRYPSKGTIVPLDEGLEEAVSYDLGKKIFDSAWAKSVLSQACARMEARCKDVGRPDIWEVFECRLLRPILEEMPPIPYQDLVERFRFESPRQASSVLTTGKCAFGRALRSVIKEYAPGRTVEEEIKNLLHILSNDDA